MVDIIIVIIILAIIAGAITKVVMEKRSGNKCIGCPHGKSCSSNCGCDSSK